MNINQYLKVITANLNSESIRTRREKRNRWKMREIACNEVAIDFGLALVLVVSQTFSKVTKKKASSGSLSTLNCKPL